MIKPPGRIGWGLFAGGAVLCLCFSSNSRAEEEPKGKSKGKDEKPGVVQLDLSKLPPELAKQLQKYLTENKKPGPPTGKGPQMAKKTNAEADLPPGLRNKPADHPGRMAYLNKPKKEAEKPKTPDKDKKPKQKDEDSSDA
jgi:hypothetical protein